MVAALHAIKIKETAMKIEAGVQEVLTYMAFSFEHDAYPRKQRH